MCSVTIFRSRAGLLVSMNRDERRQRMAELPPQLHEKPGSLRWIAPADGQVPNTWIGINEAGFGGCLLNRYQEAEIPPGESSRGTLLPRLLNQTPPSDLRAWLQQALSRSSFSPFTLITFDAAETTRWDWNGDTILGPVEIAENGCSFKRRGESWTLISSSSWRTLSVNRWRCRQFENWWRGGAEFSGLIPAYNLQSLPHLAAWSPLMSRRNTCTRSLTQVELDNSSRCAFLRYWPDPHALSREPAQHLFLPLTGSFQRHV